MGSGVELKKFMDNLIAIEEWNKEHSYRNDSRLTDQLIEKGISLGNIIDILKIIDNTCNHCWDGPSNCQCWNDE